MTDLTEFLLARIAEDERLARAGFSHPDRWVMTAPLGIPNGLSCTAVLAECDAKRRIVETMREGEWEAGWTLADRVLGALALPYADHPDFREEWRA